MDIFVQSSNEKGNDDFFRLTPLDQFIPRLYVRLILYLQPPNSFEEDRWIIFSALEKGLQATLAEIPYLGGAVGVDDNHTGRVRITPGRGVSLRVNTLEDNNDISYQTLKDSRFSHSCLGIESSNVETPVDIVSRESKQPVMVARVNIVKGGLILAIGIHHSAMDAAGIATVLKTWAGHTKTKFLFPRATGDEAAKPNLLPPNSLDRNPLIRASTAAGVDPQVKIKDHPQYKLQPTTTIQKDTEDAPTTPSTFTLPPLTLTVFYFAVPKLAALKSSASPSSSFISTNDALCALLWSSITRARNFPENTAEGLEIPSSILGFVVDGRRRLSTPLSPSYVGNAILYASTGLPVSMLSRNTELKSIATAIRSAITDIDNARIQDVMALINSVPNVTDLKPAFNSFLGPDLVITSWRDMGLVGLDWGAGIGKVEAVRLPNFAFDGVCVVMPALADGGLEVVVGLENSAMERLKRDEVFMAAAEVICN